MSIDEQLQKEAEQIVRLAGRKHLKNQLKEYDSSSSSASKTSPNILRRLIVLAAAAVLIMVPVWWIMTSSTPSNDQLFAEYFEPYRSPESTRGEIADTELLWKEAVANYADEDFNSAALKFEELIASDDNYLVQFYLGQSLLNLDASRAGEAAVTFEKVVKSEEKHDFVQQAQWYMALALLKAPNVTDASQTLKQISETEGHYKQAAAKQLLNRLKL